MPAAAASSSVSENVVHFVLVAGALVLVMFVLTRYRNEDVSVEEFADTLRHASTTSPSTMPPSEDPAYALDGEPDVGCGPPPVASEPVGNNEDYRTIGEGVSNTLPKDCYPKDQLSPQDLLPSDANSTWAQMNPAGQGDLQSHNFLNAGHHIGVNTTGQTLRNSNVQLRSEPPNPQMKVSPWNQSTIEPDTNRRGLEIGGCA